MRWISRKPSLVSARFLAAAQQQVETKIKELQDVKGELQTLLHMVDEQQKARIDSGEDLRDHEAA